MDLQAVSLPKKILPSQLPEYPLEQTLFNPPQQRLAFCRRDVPMLALHIQDDPKGLHVVDGLLSSIRGTAIT
jgi:hypothetical protein